MTNYYSLLVREPGETFWRVEFGSYERSDVEFEADEYLDSGCRTKIVTTDDSESQEAIYQAVAAANTGRF